MANPYHHSISSVKKWGGQIEDYLRIHEWFDASKEMLGDFRHRALRHHTQGIYEAQRIFGYTITLTNENGKPYKEIPTRWVGEQHVMEDLGFMPTLADWLSKIKPEPWMNRGVSKELENEDRLSFKKATKPESQATS